MWLGVRHSGECLNQSCQPDFTKMESGTMFMVKLFVIAMELGNYEFNI